MYLSVNGSTITFKYPGSYGILDTDVEISDEIYYKYYSMKAKKINYIIKDLHGLSFDDIFQVSTATNVPQSDIKTLQDQMIVMNAKIITLENQLSLVQRNTDTMNSTSSEFMDYVMTVGESLSRQTTETTETLNGFMEFAFSVIPELQE